jgi:predicted ABC-type ATPase
MGLLDRWRKQPPPSLGKPRGGVGRAHTQGHLEYEEFNPDLQHPQSTRTYDDMARTDPDVKRAHAMVYNPIVGGTWTLEPYGGEDADAKALEQLEFVKWALWECMSPALPQHLAEAIPMVTRLAFTPFETLWMAEEYEGRQVLTLRKLDVRLPRTIQRWFQDEYNELTGIEQFLPSIEPGNGGLVIIPADRLLYYRLGAEGDNWEGQSLLRAAYKPWWIKDKLERLLAVRMEREATGLPVVYPPSSVASDPTVLDAMEEKLAAIRGGELGYLIMPGPAAEHLGTDAAQGWKFELVGFGGDSGGADGMPAIELFRDQISAAVVAEFMRLGQKEVGARATADVQQDPFYAGVEAIAGVFEEQLNRLIGQLIAFNFDDADGAPKLSMEKADSTSLVELKEFVSGLVEKGVMVPDEPLEDFLRDKADLPPADPAARAQAREQKEVAQEQAKTALEAEKAGAEQQKVGVDQSKAGVDQTKTGIRKTQTDIRHAEKRLGFEEQDRKNGNGKPVTAADVVEAADAVPDSDRPLRSWEALMALDAIENTIDEARAQMINVAGDEALTDARAIARKAGGRGVPKPPKPSDELAAAIREVLVDLYEFGRDCVRDELGRQAQPAAAPLHPYQAADDDPAALKEGGEIAARAALAAYMVVTRVHEAVAKLWLSGHSDLAVLQAAAEREADAALKAEADSHAIPVLNTGRRDEADANATMIDGSRYTSILDKNRCVECKTADDDVLRPLDDPVRVARIPPNPACKGGSRCRCMEFFQLRGEVNLADDRDRWKKGTPWGPSGPGPGRFKGKDAASGEAGLPGPSRRALGRALEQLSVSETEQVHLGPTRAGRDVLGGHSETVERHVERDADGSPKLDAAGNPQWTKARQRVHERILRGLLEGHEPQDKPVLSAMAGGPASGKSTLVDGGHADVPSDHVEINPDAIKEQLPEYRKLRDIGDPYAAAAVHEESSHLSKLLAGEVAARRFNALLDTVGNSGEGKFVGKLRAFHAAGYSVKVDYATVPVDVALERAQRRAKGTSGRDAGRAVPESYLRHTHAAVSARFRDVDAADWIDQVRVWDTSGPKPRLIYERAPGGQPTVYDPAALEQFIEKAKGD